MTFTDKFEKISEKFKKADLTALKGEFAIQVNMTDEDCGGTFYIANINDTFSVEPYDYYDHTAMITIASADFTKILGGKLNVENGISSGRFAVEGDAEQIKALSLLFPAAPKKAAPKKAAPKKAEPAKKAEAPKAEPVKAEAPKAEPVKKAEPAKAEAPKAETAKQIEIKAPAKKKK